MGVLLAQEFEIACGAKSITSSRPCGRSTRAASRTARPPSSRIMQDLMDDDDVEGIARHG